MKDYNFSFFRNVYMEFFIQGFCQHLTESPLSGLIIESNLEICRRNKNI